VRLGWSPCAVRESVLPRARVAAGIVRVPEIAAHAVLDIRRKWVRGVPPRDMLNMRQFAADFLYNNVLNRKLDSLQFLKPIE
jgi:hypothetical protein